MKTKLLLIFLLNHFLLNISFSQTTQQREEYYKKIIAKGETIIKTFNSSKKDIHDKIFSNEHDGISDRSNMSEFQSVYRLFLVNYYINLEKLTSDFDKMNNFNVVPEMDYLKKMDTIQEKKLSILSNGIKFYEEISTEINSKPYKRWDPKVIDNFILNTNLVSEFEMYNRLRPVCHDIFLINHCRSTIAFLRCSYNEWDYMIQKGYKGLSKINPLHNYNIINHKIAFLDKYDSSIDLEEEALKIKLKDVYRTKFDFSRIMFFDYANYYVFSSWMNNDNIQNKSRNNDDLYDQEIANSNNALLLVHFILSYDFLQTKLSEFFGEHNIHIKKCTINEYNNYYNFYMYDDSNFKEMLTSYNNDTAVTRLVRDKEQIKLLFNIIPEKSPWFFKEMDNNEYKENIKKFDPVWYNVYEIKSNLIITQAYFTSIQNDLEFNNGSSVILNDWYNQKLDKHYLKSYYQNDYTKWLKLAPEFWPNDKIYLDSVLNDLKILKQLLKSNMDTFITKYSSLKSSNELNDIISSNRNKFTDLEGFDKSIISENLNEVNYRRLYNKYDKNPSDLNILGRRCLISKSLINSEKYLNAALRISDAYYEKSHISITLNLAHVLLFKGEYSKAKNLYTTFPIDKVMPDISMNIKTKLKMDFEEFEKLGFDRKKIDQIKKDLGI